MCYNVKFRFLVIRPLLTELVQPHYISYPERFKNSFHKQQQNPKRAMCLWFQNIYRNVREMSKSISDNRAIIYQNPNQSD